MRETDFSKLPFKITSWEAWCPSITSKNDWQVWAKQGLGDPFKITEINAPPATFLPIGMRKKLSDLCKLVLHLSHHVLQGRNDIRIVMASRYGECELTLELLEAVGRQEPSSPMIFSRSVMNSSLGLFSIFSKNQKPSTCVSAMRNTFSSGLFEALCQVYSYNEPVLFLYVEEKILEVFKNYAELPPVSLGMGFLLEKGEQHCPRKTQALEFLRNFIKQQC